jgi:hypothetical protein
MASNDAPVPADPSLDFYREALGLLHASGIPFLVGGTFAYTRYTGLDRGTKDLDIFVRRADVLRTLTTFEEAGCRTELPYPHWLGKVLRGGLLIDVVFSSGNGVAEVDDDWFTYAAEAEVLGMRLRLCPPEEMIWSKSFVQERERFDGADVLHLLLEAGPDLNWRRLLARFGDHWPVLLSHLVLFRFVYPDRRDHIPAIVIEELVGRFLAQRQEPANRICYGTLLSREQFLVDLERLGYQDARVTPHGTMTDRQTRIWTDAIGKKGE